MNEGRKTSEKRGRKGPGRREYIMMLICFFSYLVRFADIRASHTTGGSVKGEGAERNRGASDEDPNSHSPPNNDDRLSDMETSVEDK